MSKFLKWIGARAQERTTYAGIGILAVALGAPKFGMQVDQIGQAVAMIAGGGLIAAQTPTNMG